MLGKMGAFVGLTEAGPAATSTGDAVAAVTGVVTGDADPETQGCPCPFTLTRKQRFHGFFACFGIGMVFSLLSTLFLFRPVTFALLLSFGNITSYAATGFLIGPRRQCKSACEAKRAPATVIFFGAIIGTILAAVYVQSVILCLVLIIIQYCALVWYTASYIPFAQAMIASTCKSCFARAAG